MCRQVGYPQSLACNGCVDMLDALHLDLDAVILLAAGYVLLCKVMQLQELLLQLRGRGQERAHILWHEHEPLVVERIQANAHAQSVHFHHNAFDAIVLPLLLQPLLQHPAACRMVQANRVCQHVVHVYAYLCFDCLDLLLTKDDHFLVACSHFCALLAMTTTSEVESLL